MGQYTYQLLHRNGVSGYVLNGTITINTSEGIFKNIDSTSKARQHSLVRESRFESFTYADLFVSSLVGMISAFASSASPSGLAGV